MKNTIAVFFIWIRPTPKIEGCKLGGDEPQIVISQSSSKWKDDMEKIDRYLSREFKESGKVVNTDMEAQLVASLMIQSNALISIKTATKLCSISRQEIDRRIQLGTFPLPLKLSSDEKAIKKAFRVHDIQEWLSSPAEYLVSDKNYPQL